MYVKSSLLYTSLKVVVAFGWPQFVATSHNRRVGTENGGSNLVPTGDLAVDGMLLNAGGRTVGRCTTLCLF